VKGVPVPRDPQPWFRARHPEGHHGFQILHWKGFAITVALVVVVASLLIGPWVVFGRRPVLMVVGGLVTAGALVAFVAVVRAKTERWREKG
jgi:hypothetical protein